MRKKQNLTTTKNKKKYSVLCSSCFSPSWPQQMMITTNDVYNKADDNPERAMEEPPKPTPHCVQPHDFLGRVKSMQRRWQCNEEEEQSNKFCYI
jgi:hypothetical protein